jgi:nucleoside-diphosphate-sugar epimerase
VYNRPNTVGLRLGTVSGFSKNMRIENLLNALTLCAIEKNEISISNGSLMRSALGMSDLCRAIEAIIRKGKVKRPIYNLTSVNDSIVNFGYSIQKMKPNVRLVTSNALKTGYSFNCSNELFKKDYNFEFLDTVESIYSDIEYNYHNIVHSVPRSVKSYY